MGSKVEMLPAEQEAELKLKAGGGVEDGTKATFTIYKVEGDEEVDTVEGSVEKGVSQATWTAKGPDPEAASELGDDGQVKTPASRNCRVYFKVKVDGQEDEATSPELEVYLDKLEVEAVDEEGNPVADCPFRIRVGPRKKPKAELERDTENGGTGLVDALPPGPVDVSWRSPARFLSWETHTAAKVKAKVKPAFRAQISWPLGCCDVDGEDDKAREEEDTKERVHRQFVNLKPDSKQPERGSKIRVKVKVHPEDGGGAKGDLIYAKLEYPPAGELSKRKATRGFKGEELTQELKLKKDGGEVAFEIDLGQAGGDWVKISVGGTSTCEDDALKIVNWRRCYYQVTKAEDTVLPSFDRCSEHLGEVFVEYKRYKTVTFGPDNTPKKKKDGIKYSWVASSEWGETDGKTYLVIGGHNSSWFRKKFSNKHKPVGIHMMVCDKQYDAGEAGKDQSEVVSKDLEAAEDKLWLEDGEHFPKHLFSGDPPFVKGDWYSLAPPGHKHAGKKGKIKAGWCTFDRSDSRSGFKIKLPSSADTEPGSMVGDGAGDDPTDEAVKHKVRVILTVRSADGPYLGESDGYHQLIVRTPGDDCFNDTVVHELGHNMRQAPYAGDNEPPKDMDLASHGQTYVDHGHDGEHCWFGIDDQATHVEKDGEYKSLADLGEKAHDQASYEDLYKDDKGDDAAFGTCTMYGSGPDEDAESVTTGFCEKCQPFVKARALTTLNNASPSSKKGGVGAARGAGGPVLLPPPDVETLGPFTKLWEAYPGLSPLSDPQRAYVKNPAAVNLCTAMAEVPEFQELMADYAGELASKAFDDWGDKPDCGLNADELAAHIDAKADGGSKLFAPKQEGVKKSDLGDKTGLIYFKGLSEAYRYDGSHLELWDGKAAKQGADYELFEANEVWFWEIPDEA